MLQYGIAALFCGLALRSVLPAALQRPPTAFALLLGLSACAATAVLLWLGPGGSRISPAQSNERESAGSVGDGTADRFWTLDIFCFNRDDSSVMVETRFGNGYTVNFARPIAGAIVLRPVLLVSAGVATITVRQMSR